jgi:hypothetical protein
MLPSRLIASIAFLVFMFSLDAAANAAQVQIGVQTTAPVFPYGQAQLFQVLGNTSGKNCSFSWYVQLNGANVQGQGGSLPAVNGVNAPLPWNSPDLRLPSSNGQDYTLIVIAASTASNTCTGTVKATFQVEPQIGTLGKISVPAVAAVNQTISFAVTGTTYGYCSYSGAITLNGTQVAHSTISTLPYYYTAAFPTAGNYSATADEIDVNGRPQGCTGHLTTGFTVVARPVCPQANQYYQSSDDSEFGCLVNGVWLSAPAAYTCPTGYDAFDTAGQTTEWGCREPGKLALTPSQIGVLSGAALNVLPSSGATPKPTSPPATSNPTIVSVQSVVHSGGLWRPNSNVFYAGEDYSVSVVGNIPNSGGYDPAMCAYTVQVINSINQVVLSPAFTNFNTWDVGAIPYPGHYQVKVIPDPNAGAQGPCGGSASIADVYFYPQAAWVTGFELSGFGHHFAGGTSGSAWSGQWCQNCDSIFSPAHDTAFLEMVPTIQGATAGGTCAYNVQFNGHSFDGNNSMNLGQNQEVLYKNGQPGLPASQPNLYSGYNPFWSQWSDSSNTAQVTITAGNDLIIPPCIIAGGTITKSITFTDNYNLPPVVVH